MSREGMPSITLTAFHDGRKRPVVGKPVEKQPTHYDSQLDAMGAKGIQVLEGYRRLDHQSKSRRMALDGVHDAALRRGIPSLVLRVSYADIYRSEAGHEQPYYKLVGGFYGDAIIFPGQGPRGNYRWDMYCTLRTLDARNMGAGARLRHQNDRVTSQAVEDATYRNAFEEANRDHSKDTHLTRTIPIVPLRMTDLYSFPGSAQELFHALTHLPSQAIADRAESDDRFRQYRSVLQDNASGRIMEMIAPPFDGIGGAGPAQGLISKPGTSLSSLIASRRIEI